MSFQRPSQSRLFAWWGTSKYNYCYRLVGVRNSLQPEYSKYRMQAAPGTHWLENELAISPYNVKVDCAIHINERPFSQGALGNVHEVWIKHAFQILVFAHSSRALVSLVFSLCWVAAELLISIAQFSGIFFGKWEVIYAFTTCRQCFKTMFTDTCMSRRTEAVVWCSPSLGQGPPWARTFTLMRFSRPRRQVAT